MSLLLKLQSHHLNLIENLIAFRITCIMYKLYSLIEYIHSYQCGKTLRGYRLDSTFNQ